METQKSSGTCFIGVMLAASVFFGSSLMLSGAGDPVPAEQKNPARDSAVYRLEPALAVRTPACITCHAKIHSTFISDFGYGDDYFFGKASGGSTLGSFNGNIYGDFYGGEPKKTGWLTAEIAGNIIVPKAGFSSSLSAAAGAELAGLPAYQLALRANTLAKYLQALEDQKPKPSKVLEKDLVFIGAPNAATLEERFHIAPGSNSGLKYIRNDPKSSPEIEGIELSAGKNYYTNTKQIVCDGDLFVGGTLFLNRLTLSTRSGCRIYATGPIFLQHAVATNSLAGNSQDSSNLQLVSSEAILLGLGDKSCDPASKDSPLARRLQSGYAVSTFVTRDAHQKLIPPLKAGQSIYEQGRRIESLEDASCHDDTLGFSRLLLNAPQIHSRYKGKFRGLVIGEVVLFRLGKSDFEFDPVFKRVPVLPVLKDSDYLVVQ